jgi:hypothetical protein
VSRVNALNYSYSSSEHKQTTRLLSVEYVYSSVVRLIHPPRTALLLKAILIPRQPTSYFGFIQVKMAEQLVSTSKRGIYVPCRKLHRDGADGID